MIVAMLGAFSGVASGTEFQYVALRQELLTAGLCLLDDTELSKIR